MRSLVYFVAVTLDGYIGGTDRDDPDFFPFEGPHVTDLLTEFPEMIPGHLRAPLWLAGGGRLAASLVDEIDELILKVNPTSSVPAPRCSAPSSARDR